MISFENYIAFVLLGQAAAFAAGHIITAWVLLIAWLLGAR
jgi:hypothetical protein